MVQIMISGQANFKPFFIIQIIVEIIISEQVVLLQKSLWQQLALNKNVGETMLETKIWIGQTI